MKAYLDGRMIDADAAGVAVTDRGLTLGDGLYETIAVRSGAARRVDAHLARLRAGAEATGIPLGAADGDLVRAFADVITANGIDEGVLRLTLTRGPAPRGLRPPETVRPTLIVAGSAQALASGREARAVVALVTRRNDHSPLSRIKSTSALDNVLAAAEARERGADDAILLNTAGNLAEAASANLFLVIDGAVATPPVTEGALPGVMRADVIANIDVTERALSPAEIAQASEAFLTNSLGIRPLVEIDGVPVGGGRPGPVTQGLQAIA